MRPEEIAAAALAGMNGDCEPVAVEAQDVEVRQAEETTTVKSSSITGSEGDVEANPSTTSGKRSGKKKDEIKFPVEPRVVQVIKKPRTFMNHSYRDFSGVPKELGYEIPTEIKDMSFPLKVHHILSQDDFKNWITWMPHGRAFRILVPKRLEQGKVLENYFGHSRYSSFLRQLSNHGIKHISQGPDRNCYYHEFMLRGLPHLCKYMPEPKDARRLIPDPDNEPDLYTIGKQHPLPDDPKFGKEALSEKISPSSQNTAAPVSAVQPSGVARLASNVAWLHTQLPPAKRQATAPPVVAQPLLSGLGTGLTKGNMDASMLQLQGLLQGSTGNQLLAAAALQATLNQSNFRPMAPQANSIPSPAEALAAILQARSPFGHL